MQYRPHVDGLRAIAISFVLLFHAGLTLFPSGFVGVDIFFVISGFLITTIIHDSIQSSRFSFITFYKRRLWRLQPVFICLILVTLATTLFFYLAEDLVLYGKSARKTVLFTSNQFFGRVTAGYFSPDSNELPLLHTWSLAIEWQCYLLLPVAIYLLHRWFGQHLAKVIYVLTILALILTLYNSYHYTNQTYYRFSSRIFEFLIGACVTLTPCFPLKWNKLFLNLLSTVAVLIIFYIASRHNISVGFPNEYALFLCVATGILIACGEYDYKPFPIRFLSLKPVIFIGLLSYSLYIWHWPLFALSHYLDVKLINLTLWESFGILFIISYFSWRFIEKTAHKLNNINAVYTVLFLLIIPVAFTYLGAYTIKINDGFPQRFADDKQIANKLNLYTSKQRDLCLEFQNKPVSKDCLLGSHKVDSKTGFMIGDSFSNHYWQFMDVFAHNANVSVLAHATGSCLALPGISQYHWFSQQGIYDVCAQQTARYYQMIKENHYDFVIISESWNGYQGDRIVNNLSDKRSQDLTKQRIEQGIEDALNIITASGAKPMLIKAIALSPKGNPHSCFFQHIKHRTKYNPALCDFKIQPEQQQWINEVFMRMQHKYPQLVIIDPQQVLCLGGVCKAAINNVPVFRDEAHITDYAAHQLAIRYQQKYKNPFTA